MKRKKNLYHDSKKGWIDVTILFVVMMFMLGIVTLIGVNLYDSLNHELQSDPDISALAKTSSAESYSRFSPTMDGVFLTLFILAYIAILVITWLTFENPLFIFIIFVLLLALLIVSALLSNTWAELVLDSDIGSLSSTMPFATHILDNFVFYILGTIASMGFVLFMRSRF